jgi:putative peptidoglycan lipid II flippase
MLKKILSVSGWTLLSRLTGFIRDLVLAAVLGAGVLMDVFTVANRLPNHFRAIFAEGAFNAAFIPAYARVFMQQDVNAARKFAGIIGVLLVLVLLALSVLAIVFMPTLITWLAPGFAGRADAFELAVILTRITFPYLILISLVTLISGVLNAHERFIAAAAAPVLLNVSIIIALIGVSIWPHDAPLSKDTFAYAAAWGVLSAGIWELILVIGAAARARVVPIITRPAMTSDVKGFLCAFAPATIGSMGTQLAMFVDTILVTFLAIGGASALYYADRLYQLPLGVIGIAVGTVILPHMSRLIAQGDVALAFRAQNRAISFALVLAAPCVVMCLLTPQLLFEALFMRGAFDLKAAQQAGEVLSAYAIGLPAMVILRAIVASFYARQDTMRPVIASLSAIMINVALKFYLMPTYGAAGLAFSTACGAWMNVAILYVWAFVKGWIKPDSYLIKHLIFVCFASLITGACVMWLNPRIAAWGSFENVTVLGLLPATFMTLALLGSVALFIYSVLYLVLKRALRT